MKSTFHFLCICLCFQILSGVVGAQGIALPRATPESQGVSTPQILKFVQEADERVNSIHSLMVVRHGKVVAEAWWAPEAAEKPHILWSLSKSFTSTAVGFAIDEGLLNLHDKVLSFFPDAELDSAPSTKLKNMRIIDLLTMTAGHQEELNIRALEGDWVTAFLNHPVPHLPGTHFKYNTPATYMLSAIVQKVTGENLVEYLTPRLFQPLGISEPRWDQSPQGISLGGFGLFLKTEDIAKFGLLYLQKGKWNNKQLLPEAWVEQATSKQVSNGSNPDSDWNQGYGFQFWRCRHGAFRGDGKSGQFCIVLPDQDAVIAITSNTRDMGAEMNLVWDYLLPAFQPDALPEDAKAQARMKQLVEELKASR